MTREALACYAVGLFDLCGKPSALSVTMATAVCAGLTLDRRFFDIPVAAVVLIFGIMICWSNCHHNRAHAAAGFAVAEPIPRRHG